jgi:hypothetical protein
MNYNFVNFKLLTLCILLIYLNISIHNRYCYCFTFGAFLLVNPISKIILVCIDDSLCSKHDDKGGSSHIQSQRQQWQLCGGLIFNDPDASNWKHSPCFLSPFFLYIHLLGRNLELSSYNNHLALVILSSCKLFQAVCLHIALGGGKLHTGSLFLKSTSMVKTLVC